MTDVLGQAVIEVGADTTGLRKDVNRGVTSAFSKTDTTSTTAGKRASKRFGGTFITGMKGIAGPAAAIFSAAAVGSVVKSSVSLAADYEQTMNVLQAATGATKDEMKALSAQAMQLGADTVFSAQEAADAMLELGKAGFSTKQTMAAVPEVMNLAATEGLALSDAAGTVSSVLAQFGLQAEDAGLAVNALAGASNASKASVAGLSESLKLVGSAAAGIGLSVPETTGALAALAQNGLEGSIAGTSLAAVFNRLIPTTTKAKNAMKELGINFVKPNGEFKSMAQIAGILQDSLSRLSPAARKVAIGQMFGRDASTIAAVNALVASGAKGIKDYTKASNDQSAAQKLSDARMSGLKGALEALSGSWETLKLQLGTPLLTGLAVAAHGLAEGLNGVVPAVESIMGALSSGGGGEQFAATFGAVSDFAKAMLPTLTALGDEAMDTLLPAFKGLADVFTSDVLPAFNAFLPAVEPVAKFLLKFFGEALIGAVNGLVMVFKGAFKIIAGVLDVFTGILTGDWSRAWSGLKSIMSGALTAIVGALKVWWNVGILNVFRKGILFLTKGLWTGLWAGLKAGASKGLSLLIGLARRGLGVFFNIWKTVLLKVPKLLLDVGRKGVSALTGALRQMWSATKNGVGNIFSAIAALPGRILSLGGKFLNAGKGIIRKLVDGMAKIGTGASGVGRAIANAVIEAINNYIIGPFNDLLDKAGIHKFGIDIDLGDYITIPNIPKFATGVTGFGGGLALTGETGPELVNLPRNSDVYTGAQTRRILDRLGSPDAAPVAGASTRTVTQNINVVQTFPSVASAKGAVRELEWTLRYGTGAKRLAQEVA